jgi:hypothetical protein
LPEVRQHPFWTDPRWKRELKKLPAAQQRQLLNSLSALLQALGQCRDPLRDNDLSPWQPSSWAAPSQQLRGFSWVEYYLWDRDNRGRAIISFNRKTNILYLVGRTPTHDLAALRELTAKFRP